MNIQQLIDALESRKAWMEEHGPEILDRPVFFIRDTKMYEVRDVFVENFLLLTGPPEDD